MDNEIRVVIADDHPLLRKGLAQLIASDARLVVAAEAGDGLTALATIEEIRPEIAVLDIDMPGLNGLEVVQAIARKKLPTQVVFLTIHSEEDLFHAAMDCGAKGYLLKESALTEVVDAIRAVAQGRHYVTPSLSASLVRRNRQSRTLRENLPGLDDLTATERRILSLVAAEKSSKEIAAELFIHHRTVENHRTNICQKLGLHGHSALFKFALQHKSEL
jgi:DNA-binding NarL/FixJ family response regulator